MAKKVSNDQLRAAFEAHLEVTKEQVKRLETTFDELERSPRGKKCRGKAGPIEEGAEMMGQHADPAVVGAALIASARRVERHEIAAYGTART